MTTPWISSAAAHPGSFSRMKTPALRACLLIGAGILASQTAFAAIVCFPDGSCFSSEQTCADFIPGDGAECYDTTALTLNPRTDYLLSTGGKAWLVKGDKKTPVNSDAFESFLKEVNSKYRSQARKDPQILKQFLADISAARKKSDGKVSPDRLKSIARKLNLRIMDKEPRK